uniref:Uncharacterized protein n=1 Tax=Strigamia maritima TaxID=126957 RepID=T1IWH1_STRMM
NNILLRLVTPPYHFGHLFQHNVVTFSIKKFKFINRKQFACVNNTAMEQCQIRCYEKEALLRKFTCQLPFLPTNQRKNCTTNQLTCDFLQQLQNITKTIIPNVDFMLSFCCYFIYGQIVTFMSYRTYQTIELVQDDMVEIPALVMCTEPESIYDEKAKIKAKKQVSVTCVEDIDFLELLDEPKFKENADLLWEETGDISDYEMAEVIYRIAAAEIAVFNLVATNMSYITSIFGKCVHFQSVILKYTPRDTGMIIPYQSVGLRCNTQTKVYVFNENKKRMDIDLFAMLPHNSWMAVILFKQTVHRLNSPINPCTSPKQFETCEVKCLKYKLSKQNIKCRLPFINSSLPLCKNTNSAKSTRKSYLNVFSNVDAIRDCNCPPPCIQIIYYASTEYMQTIDFQNIVMTKMQFESNINEIFKQNFVMPFAKFISDMGAILGFFLGISVLSCLELWHFICSFINEKEFSK